MKLSALIINILTAIFLVPTAVSAETSFILQLPILDYSETSTTITSNESSGISSKSSSLETAQLENSYLSIGMDSFVLYFYPFADLGYVSASYVFNETIEVGIDVGLNSSKFDNSENKSSSTLFGLFAGYFSPLFRENITGEYYLFLSQSSVKETSIETVETNEKIQKSDSVQSSFKLTTDAVISLTKNVSYVAGVSFFISRDKEKESNDATKTSQIGFRFASIRVVFP